MRSTLAIRAYASVFFLSTMALAQPQFYADQPASKRSTIFGDNWEAITDAEFANMAGGLLLKNGNSNARGATFLFAQCFSGGMLDDLDVKFSSEVRWVGGAAARYDELSWGEGNSKPFPLDFWPKALYQGFDTFADPLFGFQMIDYINFAREADQAGPNGSGKETPQSIYRNGGQTIDHRASIPFSDGGHNAILWAGFADGKRHVNDIKVMYDQLSTAFAATGDPWSIIVLGNSVDLGIDALPATKANLQFAFNALENIQGPNDNFYFFSSNHGGSDTVIIEQPQNIGVDSSLISRVSISDLEWEGIFGTPEGMPGITFDFDRLVGRGLRVFVEGVELDDPFVKKDALGDPFLCIDRDILRRIGPDFEIRLINETGDRITLREMAFRTGGITNVVPEVNSLILLSAGVGAGVFWVRRRSAASTTT